MVALEALGLLGGACFAYCGVPAAWATVKKGRSIGTPVSVAWMITLGSVLMYAYLFMSYGFNTVLAINYTVEFLSWATLVWYHYRPRRSMWK